MLQSTNHNNITLKALIGGGGLLLALSLVLVPATDLAFAQTSESITISVSEITSTGATVTWNQYKTDTEYVVALRDGNGGGIPGGVTRVTGTTHDITGLTPDTDYRVFVRTIGAGHVKSNIISFKTTDSAFSFTNTIANFTMNEAEIKTIPLSVTPASDSVTYAITKQDGTTAPRFAFIAPVSSNGTNTDGIVLIPDRTEDGEYLLRVTATIGNDTATENFALTVSDSGIDPPQIKTETSTSVTIEVASEDYNPQDATCTFADIHPTSSGPSSAVSHSFRTNPLTITGLLPDTAYTIIVGKECIPIGHLGTLQFPASQGSVGQSSQSSVGKSSQGSVGKSSQGSVGQSSQSSVGKSSQGSVGQSSQGNFRFPDINDITMAEGTVHTIQLNVIDPDNRDITYSVVVLNDEIPGSVRIFHDNLLQLAPDRTAAGKYTLRVTATAGSDTTDADFVLTVSDPGISPPKIKTKTSTSVTVEVASEDHNPRDVTCTFADIYQTSSGPSGVVSHSFRTNPLTITGLSPDTAYTITVGKECIPIGQLGTLQFTTSSSDSQT